MGLVRRPRRRAHVGVRRDVPHEPVDVHLRQRLPGRAHRAGARARSRAAARYGAHFTDEADRSRVERAGRAAHRRGVAVQEQSAQPRRPDQGQRGRRDRHPARRRRLHLPQPARVPRRPRLRPAPRRPRRGRAPARLEARGVLAAAAAPDDETDDVRPRHLHAPRVEAPRLGRGRRRVPLVVHRGARGVRRPRAGVRDACATRSSRWSAQTAYDLFVEHVAAPERHRTSPIRRSRSGASGRRSTGRPC